MGSPVPTSPRSAVLAWCVAHEDIFRTAGSNIGLDADQVLEFNTLTSNYATAQGEVEKARIALRTAVDSANNSYSLMRRSMTQAISDIRYFALQQANPQTVYDLAQVPPRATASQQPPPGRPFDFLVELQDTTGAVQLRWKCVNPVGTSGTSYLVRRRLPTETSFTIIGVSGERRYVDNSFLAGPDSVEYTVQAQRADRAGAESAIFTINFGVATRRGTQTVTGTSEGKAAA